MNRIDSFYAGISCLTGACFCTKNSLPISQQRVFMFQKLFNFLLYIIKNVIVKEFAQGNF